ncbi:hypothetical protein HN018_24865 (plasmid) [Lichenicola cladoniae]|uniref:Uncharacterized protein n=1 Tax=Lichenicola cladoniae TaxID=1484109 RepID=A0A6M8HZA6_9PROT|nr:hypothetical protein [Lichenicola cladoniae]NPD66826.1 hypothetical protein [Acetobacteraceae bacterium]QKE93421.1 hypothetical protein HN018_24865 [Lichenicola cladoniae]
MARIVDDADARGDAPVRQLNVFQIWPFAVGMLIEAGFVPVNKHRQVALYKPASNSGSDLMLARLATLREKAALLDTSEIPDLTDM